MTFRARLVLINAAALAGLLAAFAGGLAEFNTVRLRSELVGDLRKRGDDAARGPKRPKPPPPGPVREADPYAEARRLTDLRRPRFFDAQGQGDVSLAPSNLRAALNGRPTFGETEGLFVYAVPLPEGGAVQVARETTDLDRLAAAQTAAIMVLLPVGTLFAALGAGFLARRTLRPVREIARAAEALGASDLASRLPAQGDDEFAELARTLNAMLERLQRSFEEQQRFVGDASHELRTPLSRLRLTAGVLRRRFPDDPDVAAVERSAIVLSELTQSLLTLAQADATGLGLKPVPVDLRVVVAEAIDDAPVVADFPDGPVRALADSSHLGRAVKNLVDNALRHTTPPGRVFIAVTPNVEIVVRDEGEGISERHLPHVFDRFYRADAARGTGGTGLGLAIVKEIVKAHGGRVSIESKVGEGTEVRVSLPRPTPETSSPNPHNGSVS